MNVVRPARPWDYTQQKRDFGQQELQKPQTALSRDASLEQKLREFMRNSEDWERSRTSIPGVFVVKLPGRGSRGPELALEINPVDGQGQPKKKRGYMVRGKFEDTLRPEAGQVSRGHKVVNPRTVRDVLRMIVT